MAAALALASCRGGLRPGLPAERGPAAVVCAADAFDRLFSGGRFGWTGGDGTVSLALPDGRTLWLFGDTFLGWVAADGSRSRLAPLVRNTLVLQEGFRLSTLYGRAGAAPVAFFDTGRPDIWYWPGDGIVEDGEVKLFLHRFQETGEGPWNWRWVGTHLARLGLPGLERKGIRELDTGKGIRYGVAVLEESTETVIFGLEDAGGRKYLHVARAPSGGLEGPWAYWSGGGWSGSAADSLRVLEGVSDQLGVVRCDGGVALVTMDLRRPFSGDLVVYGSPDPRGPWQGPRHLHRPDLQAGAVAYNPFAHAQFGSGEILLVSFNVNSVDNPDAVYGDASLYRPRFLWVRKDAVCEGWKTAPRP